MTHPKIIAITDRIIARSEKPRRRYLDDMDAMRKAGVARAHLSCGNQAHAYAAMDDKATLKADKAANIGIISAYNDMLSAHQPYADYPDRIKAELAKAGVTAQVAACVPAMCDGVTQGQTGMELSLFSRDAIAMSAGIGLSHNVFDAALYLGICDKIVPGLVIAAARFGHLPAVFVPAGPMRSGISNDQKAAVRKEFAEGKVDRSKLMAAEMASYHSPGTCTFYGTANTNQMLMEFMGLHIPGSSFVHPDDDLRAELTKYAASLSSQITALGENYRPVCEILDARAYVNGIIGLMASGGSTNLLIHLIAMARASGIVLTWEDFSEISALIPLLMRVYPNGIADINHFQAAGGLQLVIRELLSEGLLHEDVMTVVGKGLGNYTQEPRLSDEGIHFVEGATRSENDKIIASAKQPFAKTGGLASMRGNLGDGVMKVSAVAEEHRQITAPVAVFRDQASVQAAFKARELDRDVVVVVRYQGPRANGMPELHGLTPCLSILQGRGYQVALVTDGRMSGASGKVPAAIHVSPEALDNGPLAYLRDGDMVTVDAVAGKLFAHDEAVFDRDVTHPDLSDNNQGTGRELFQPFRNSVSAAETGASVFSY